jgi:DNA polymerase II small subunit/DNA polymerase delta subunit B
MGKRESQARIRPAAATDLEEIVRYLDSRSQEAGDRFLEEFLKRRLCSPTCPEWVQCARLTVGSKASAHGR